jgi:hypothetical protein
MKSFSKAKPPQQFRLATMGLPGSGKTTLAFIIALLEAEKDKATYIIDIDDNMSAASAPFFEAFPHMEEWIFWDTTEDLAHKELKRLNRKLDEADRHFMLPILRKMLYDLHKHNADPANKRIGHVVIDSQSTLNKYIMDYVRQDIPVDAKAKLPEGQMRIQDWGVFANYLTQFILDVRATQCDVTWAVHEKVKTKKQIVDDEVVEVNAGWELNIPGGRKDVFAGFFSDSWALDVMTDKGVTKRTLRAQRNKVQDYLKNSLQLPATDITLPNDYGKLADTIRGLIGDRLGSSPNADEGAE